MPVHSDELRGILNSGYQRDGAFVMRVTSEAGNGESGWGEGGEANGGTSGAKGTSSSSRLVSFSCWCPNKEACRRYVPRADIEAFKAELRQEVVKAEETKADQGTGSG